MNKLQIIQKLTEEMNKETHKGHSFGTLSVNVHGQVQIDNGWNDGVPPESDEGIYAYCLKCGFGIGYDYDVNDIVNDLAHDGCPDNAIEIPEVGDTSSYSQNGVVYEIEVVHDETPDLSYLGGFSNKQESDFSIEHSPNDRRQLRWYNPYNVTGEGITKKQSKKYAMQKYERMLSYGNSWYMLGIVVTAFINGVEVGQDSLWGIESDSGEDCFIEVVGENIANIESTLELVQEVVQ